MMNEMTDEMKEKLSKYYMNTSREVHITTTSKRFYNGKIISLEPDFIILIDRVIGEMPLFFKEIVGIEPAREGK